MQLRNRMVKADFWTDTALVRNLPPNGRMLYQGLWQLAEDSGCIEADTVAYKMLLFSMDDISVEDIEQWVEALIEMEKLIPYTKYGTNCYYITNFHKHQSLRNPGKPEIPLPDFIEYIPNEQPYKSGAYVIDYGALPIDKGDKKVTVGNIKETPKNANVSLPNDQGNATPTNKKENLNVNVNENNKPSTDPLDIQKTDQGNVYPNDFEEVWQHYPRKIQKKAAWRKWKARRKGGVDNEDLVAATKNYARECQEQKTEERFIKHGSTFLGPDEHYVDYVEGLPRASPENNGEPDEIPEADKLENKYHLM